MATSVAFITGHCAGSSPLELNWKALAQGIDTLVFLMGVHSLPMIVSSLIDAGRPTDTPVALIEKGTLPEQKVVIGTLADIMDKTTDVHPPSIVIVGEVVNLHSTLKWFEPQAVFSVR
jgi:siroheme synthase